MRWAPIVEKPPRDGQYYVWSARLGKCVMGYREGSWGALEPVWWLQADQNPPQACDGSFDHV